jgi:hypothetical protein
MVSAGCCSSPSSFRRERLLRHREVRPRAEGNVYKIRSRGSRSARKTSQRARGTCSPSATSSRERPREFEGSEDADPSTSC